MGLFKNLLGALSDSLFVNFKCIFCHIETVNDSLICDECANSIETIGDCVCSKCGAKVNIGDNICLYCFDKNYNFDEHRSCFIYDDESSRPVKLLKYEKKKYLAETISRIMFAFNKEYLENVDFITFVPMTKDRVKDRGYNHGEELAKCLSKISGIPIIRLLEKVKSTQHQAELNFSERCENLKGSFELSNQEKYKLNGKCILIVDDVFTTGSTLSECSRIIRKVKPKHVKAITFLKTDPFKDKTFR